jgi:hypothetical protein
MNSRPNTHSGADAQGAAGSLAQRSNGPGEVSSLDTLSLEELMEQWSHAHVDLAHRIEATQRWLAQVRHQHLQGYGELAAQLKGFRQWLLTHFEREQQLGEQLQRVRDCLEMSTSRRQIASDHQHLTRRIDMLIQRLDELEPPFDSFDQAVEDVGLFIDAFELHEEHETQCLQWLTARPLDVRKLPR